MQPRHKSSAYLDKFCGATWCTSDKSWQYKRLALSLNHVQHSLLLPVAQTSGYYISYSKSGPWKKIISSRKCGLEERRRKTSRKLHCVAHYQKLEKSWELRLIMNACNALMPRQIDRYQRQITTCGFWCRHTNVVLSATQLIIQLAKIEWTRHWQRLPAQGWPYPKLCCAVHLVALSSWVACILTKCKKSNRQSNKIRTFRIQV